MSGATVFRGQRQVSEVIDRLQPLAAALRAHSPTCGVITLPSRDLELLCRWPQAAALHDIFTRDGVVHWRGFELRSNGRIPGSSLTGCARV